MKNKLLTVALCLVIVIIAVCLKPGHIHLPGHGNWENRNFERAVVQHVASGISQDKKVELIGKYSCEDYEEEGEMKFSAHVIYEIVTTDGARTRHTAHVVCNEDKDTILDWEETHNESIMLE